MDYTKNFLDIMDEINNKAKDKGFVNGKALAKYAFEKRLLSYSQYQKYDKLHGLRVQIAHGNAMDISISESTYSDTKHYKSLLFSFNLFKPRERHYVNEKLFRYQNNEHPNFTKVLNWNGYGGRKYIFKFILVWEYQNRSFSDNTHYSGYGYSIYIKQSPCQDWCREKNRNRVYDFHFYDPNPNEVPTICWARKITSFEEANAIFLEWASRYKKMLDNLYATGKVNEKYIEKTTSRRGLVPGKAFRYTKKSKKRSPKEKIYIKDSVYEKIMETLGSSQPEMGGMLGWSVDDKSIDEFVLDDNAYTNGDTYAPNVDKLNKIINDEWFDKGIYLAGFIHSHPGNSYRLSQADIKYGVDITKSFGIDFVILPIVTSSFESKARIYPYLVFKNGTVKSCSLIKYSEETSQETAENNSLKQEISDMFDQMGGITFEQKTEFKSQEIVNPIFDRISTVINLQNMKKRAIIAVGLGGARGFIENMARVGVGNFYLIDGDTVSRTNIASQNGFLSEIGKPKVQVAKERILDINDECNVETFNFMLDDKITDNWLYENIVSKYNKEDILLCASTDNLAGQKRCQDIAKKFNIPYLASGHHKFGETSEILYWYPGISKYDPEYILKERYEAYQNGNKEDISSVGSPIFNTSRLNALCEKIALGILAYPDEKEGKTNFSSFLKFDSSRNYIIIRQQDLSIKDNQLEILFGDNDRYLFDDVIWLDPDEII